MRRPTCIEARRDEGFTLAELVLAAAILSFTAIAILSLMMATQRQVLVAKERADLQNAVSGYMERIRGRYAYYQIGTIAASTTIPTGTVTETTVTTGVYTIRITPTITWKADSYASGETTHAYKLVRLDGRAWVTATGSDVLTFTAETIVTTAGAR